MPIAQRSGRHAPKAGVFTTRLLSTKVGDVAYTKTDGFFRPGITNVGFTFQNVGAGTVDVAYTYDNPELATDKTAAVQAGIHWSTQVSGLAANAISGPTTQSFPTAIKVTFSSATGGVTVISN